MRVKEEREKADLKFNVQRTKIMAPGPITSWQIDGKTVKAVRDFILGGSKTIVLSRWTIVSKVMSLLFNMLSRLVLAFLPRSMCLLTLWLQLPSAVILESKKIKSVIVSIVSPSMP